MTAKADKRRARTLRIIGGSWRSRTWRFPEGGIRPTPDRVRETLFNWLGPAIAGARCLDLFAGSGALGLEALSRGAARAVFVEQAAAPARELKQTLALWGGEQAAAAQIQVADALRFLTGKPEAFDVVFLDPPFAAGLLGRAAAALEAGHWLAPAAQIYAERPAREPLPAFPERWCITRSGRAGEVGYHLLRRTP
ncbi:MAG TPA: 16S rRNA (guanine(966)-N(2))-methyltransferase RsmD [Steroidobacteraceae bacterium]|nr:16S rRNA (guanine(966)-N(2))-methyltransferase RsmD [Steroidobacteraceae bacterium]